MEIKDRIKNEVIEGSRISIIMKNGAKLSGCVKMYAEDGIKFEGIIPYAQILEYDIPKEKGNRISGELDNKRDDYATPQNGETIVIYKKDGTVFSGRYNREDNDVIQLEINGNTIVEDKSNIAHLYMCGVITSYNILNKSGVVNNKYKFNKIKVDTNSNIFKRLDKDNQHEKNKYMCLYEIKRIGGNNAAIIALDDFDDVKSEIKWLEGEITGVSSDSSYFIVDDEVRCYLSNVDDKVLIQYKENDDLQKQDVLYKKVYHRIGDDKRIPNKLSTSVIEIRSKSQIGRTVRDGLTRKIRIQCGRYNYKYIGEELPENIYVLAELSIDEYGQEYVARIISRADNKEDINLPTHKEELEKRRNSIIEEKNSAERREDFKEQFDTALKLLEENLLPQKDVFLDLLKASINSKRSERNLETLIHFKDVLKEYGYLLPENILCVYRMQLSYLNDDFEDAQKQAKIILSKSVQYKAEILFQAKSVLSGEIRFPKNELEAWILYGEELIGTIDSFDNNTDTGCISVDNQQYGFHWKDVDGVYKNNEYDLRNKEFDFKNKRYIVSFGIDEKYKPDVKGIPRAKCIVLRDVVRMTNYTRQESLIGDDFDEELENMVNLQRNEWLDTVLKDFSLDEIKKYLSTEEQGRIKNGEYQGIPTRRINIVTALDELHDHEKWDEEYFSKAALTMPKNDKTRLLLARAKIISQYLQSEDFKKHGPKEKLDKDTMNRVLYEYAYDNITGYYSKEDINNITPGTMAYYAESIMSLDLNSKKIDKMHVANLCIARYYQGGWSDEWDEMEDCESKGYFSTYLHNNCNDVDGLIRMLLSFPKKIIENVLDDDKYPQYEGMLQLLSEKIPKINEMPGETVWRKIENFHTAWNKTKDSLVKKQVYAGIVRKDAKEFLNSLDYAGNDFVEFLFEEDQEYIKELKIQLLDLMENTDDESPTVQHNECPKIYRELYNLAMKIKEKPTKFSFEDVLPYIENMCNNLAEYIEKIYRDNAPKIMVEHCSLTEDNKKEILCLSNEMGRLRAEKIHVEVCPCGEKRKFIINKRLKQLPEFDFKADPGEAIEIMIPIEYIEENVRSIDMNVKVQYQFLCKFDRINGEGVWHEIKYPLEMVISIPVGKETMDLIEKKDNPYRELAGGRALVPQDRKMFFGRDKVIESIYYKIVKMDGYSIDTRSMTAFYGQKRSGKTSIMNFLEDKIINSNTKAVVLMINAQSLTIEDNKPSMFMQKMLAAIVTSLKNKLNAPRFKELRKGMKELNLNFPSPKDFIDNSLAEFSFLDFFQKFNTYFSTEYPIVVMIDEFTRVYIEIKENRIRKDFLNQWRALVSQANFASVYVGQDFMPKFFTDETLAQGVNGLSTISTHEIGYLNRLDAYKMMEIPILKKDGSSRFQGELGEKAKEKIFDLTGGSAFYLMKFMNGMVNYMVANHYELVTPSLVEDVLDRHIFITQDNPIEKKDFDPIYNEYSSSLVLREKPKDTDTLRGQEEIAKRVYELFIEIARCVSEHGNGNGVCCISNIKWDDEIERNEIIKTLKERRILVDPNGNDIVGKEIRGLEFKVKVGLFVEYLIRRVLNQEG